MKGIVLRAMQETFEVRTDRSCDNILELLEQINTQVGNLSCSAAFHCVRVHMRVWIV